jgi:hypothetical protein
LNHFNFGIILISNTMKTLFNIRGLIATILFCSCMGAKAELIVCYLTCVPNGPSGQFQFTTNCVLSDDSAPVFFRLHDGSPYEELTQGVHVFSRQYNSNGIHTASLSPYVPGHIDSYSLEVNVCFLPQAILSTTNGLDVEIQFDFGPTFIPSPEDPNFVNIQMSSGQYEFNCSNSSCAYSFESPGDYVICSNSTCLLTGESFDLCEAISLSYPPPPCPPNIPFEVINNLCNGITIDPDITPDPNDPNPFSVDWGDGSFDVFSSMGISHEYSSLGEYNVCVSGMDLEGNTYNECTSVIIQPNCACSYHTDFSTSVSGCEVTILRNDGSDQEVEIFWGDGSSTTTSDTSVSHAYANNGVFEITIRTTCNDGIITSSSQVINILDCSNICALPTSFEKTIEEYTMTVTTFTFPLGEGSFMGDLEFFWSFGDGTTSTVAMPSHTFPGDGTYITCWTVTCTNTGAQVTLYETLSVGEGCCPLPVDIQFEIDGLSVQAISINIPGFEGMDWSGYEFFYNWGDGFFSSEPLPTHEYPEAGTFSACILCACDVCGARFYMYPSFTVEPNNCELPNGFFTSREENDNGITEYFNPGSLPFDGNVYLCSEHQDVQIQWSINGEVFSEDCATSRLLEEEGIYFITMTAICPDSGTMVEITKDFDGLGQGTSCIGDLDNSGQVNIADMLLMLSVFGNSCSTISTQ